MIPLIRESLLAVYFIPEEDSEERGTITIGEDGELFLIYNNLFEEQKNKLLWSIKEGFREVSFSARRMGHTYFIEKIWNSLKRDWEDWSSDWPQGEEMEKYKCPREVTEENASLNKLFAAGVEEVELFFKKIAKKARRKNEI